MLVGLATMIGTAVAAGWVYARQGVARTWREVAEAREVQVQERDKVILELRERLARVEARLEAQTGELRELRKHDLSAVLEWGRKHEDAAAGRSVAVLDVLREIRDK